VADQSPIRIVVADAHPLFTLGVRALLAEDASVKIVGDASSGEEALEVLQQTRPDVFLLDLSLERVTALEVLSRMASMKLETRTVIVAATIESAELRTVLLRGARGVLLKQWASDLLAKCVRQVVKGEYWINRADVGALVDTLRRSEDVKEPASRLSVRELDIVRAVLKGASNRDIASQLGLSEQTVKNHLRRIFAKLGVQNRVELAVRALEDQLTGSETASTAQDETREEKKRSILRHKRPHG
jgi:two-component system nitrate/nitrite response regulator NarL